MVLTQEAAKAAGLPIEVLNYCVNVDTANGRTRAAPVTLDRIAIGGVVERSVPALVAQHGQLKTNLLGMSFLNRLESWEVRGDRLRMRGTARESGAGVRPRSVARKTAPTPASRKRPKPISSWRCGSQWARRTP